MPASMDTFLQDVRFIRMALGARGRMRCEWF
jgi:hypothetical protein